MKDIAVVHYDLMSKGGGEAVTMVALEALQTEYNVTLVTPTQPDWDELNDFYNTSVRPVPVDIAGRIGPWIQGRFGIQYYVLQNALLGRYIRRHATKFDGILSTINELALPVPAVQYVHFPFDWGANGSKRGDIFHPAINEDGLYERLCSRIANVDPTDFSSDVILTNSEWTARAFEDAYGIRPEICYPPIDTDPFDPVDWDEREAGFVTLGRVERSKRLVELIEIVDGVRERGHDVHIHIVGPTVDEEYAAEVSELARDREYVEFEGELTRDNLVELISNHRYGIHGKTHEHFGMAVAELAAAGCLTFVPATGGQPEVVDFRDELLYESPAEAVDTIDRVLSMSDPPHHLRQKPREIDRRFGRSRFKRRIKKVMSEVVPPKDSVRSTSSNAGVETEPLRSSPSIRD